jgi:hypothetical protein
MLDEKDLVLIGKVIDERFQKNFLEGFSLAMDHHILPHFDDLHREIAWIKGQMVTKGFLEERLENFRVDLGLRYKPAA